MSGVLVFGFLALGIGSAPWAASPLDGSYTLDKSRSASVDQAIEQVVSKMNFVTRPIARSRLTKTNTPSAKVSIAVTDLAEIDLGAKPVRAPSDGKVVAWTRPDGETFQVSIRQDGERLVETFVGKDGSRRNTFCLLDGGKALAMDVQVESPKLPEPMRYRLVFARVR
jgi:hypothetical protein